MWCFDCLHIRRLGVTSWGSLIVKFTVAGTNVLYLSRKTVIVNKIGFLLSQFNKIKDNTIKPPMTVKSQFISICFV